MKNSVAFILTFADFLIKEASQQQLNFLLPLKGAARMLMFQLGDWLDNTKLDANSFIPNLSAFRVEEAVTEVLQMCRINLTDRKIELCTYGLENLPSMLKTDRSRFQQVLLNLVTNASKYSPNDHRIDCFFKYLRVKSYIQVEVRDYGLGLLPEQIKNLFKPF